MNNSTPASPDRDAWNTPSEWLDLARQVLGGIDFDPYSSDAANAVVQATRHLTAADNALTTPWSGPRVWMNPPYSGASFLLACQRFVAEFRAGHFEEAIVLTNNCTETRGFQLLMREAGAVCFPNKRIIFWAADGKRTGGNTRAQAFHYIGPHAEKFAEVFRPCGTVLGRL